MKVKLLLTSLLALSISNTIQAAYSVSIPLDGSKIRFEDPQVTGNINLSPTTINRGEHSSITWDYTYADEINIEDVGTFHSLKGSQTVTPTENTTYKILIKSGDKSKTETLNLTVIQPNQNITFTADSYRIGYGSSTNLNWNVNNAQSVSIDSGIGSQSLSGLYKVTPHTDTTYTLTAKGFSGIADKTQSVDITVVPDATINSFTVDKDKISVGDTSTFNWSVINAESVTLNGESVDKSTGTKPVVFSTAGTFSYKLQTTSLSGLTAYSDTKTINVYNLPVIDTFTVNGNPIVDVSPNSSLNFAWATSNANTFKLNNNTVTGNNTTLTANASTGSTTYTLEALNEANKSVNKQVTVNVIGDPVINSITGPSTVFNNTTFDLTWTASGASKYTVKGNNNSSGLSTAETDIGTSVKQTVTPTTDGTFTYTITAYNTANAKKEQAKTVVVEPNPTFDSFSVNNASSVVVAAGDTLTYTGTGISAGAFYQGRTNGNDGNVNNPSTAPSTAGTYTYYMAAAKTVNNVNRYSALRSVSVRVVDQPTIQFLTATPAIVDAGQASTLSFSTANSSYNEINGVNTGSSPTYVVNPTVTTTYTLTAKNDAGQTTTKAVTVNVQTWTATTPVYGAWTNVSGKVQYACGAWSPNPATVTTNTTFTQTASCSTDQTRTRQDRIISSVTGEVKNSGAVVNETTTIAQGASRSYGVTLSGWSGSTVSSCASWSPDPSTVNSGQVFTQTGANCSLPQTRTRTENYIDHVSGANIQVSVVGQNQTLTVGGAGYTNGTRSATGTKSVGPDCRFVKDQYYIQDFSSMGSDVFAMWNGVFNDFYELNYSDPNYVYSKGAAQPSSAGLLMFQICRSPK